MKRSIHQVDYKTALSEIDGLGELLFEHWFPKSVIMVHPDEPKNTVQLIWGEEIKLKQLEKLISIRDVGFTLTCKGNRITCKFKKDDPKEINVIKTTPYSLADLEEKLLKKRNLTKDQEDFLYKFVSLMFSSFALNTLPSIEVKAPGKVHAKFNMNEMWLNASIFKQIFVSNESIKTSIENYTVEPDVDALIFNVYFDLSYLI